MFLSKYARIPIFPVFLAVVAYTLLLTYLTWVRYATLNAGTFDLGISVQLANTILQTGLPMQTPNYVISRGVISTNFFGVHVSPVRYLFAGVYWLYRDPVTLLFIQALAVALGSIPIYKLSMHLLGDRRTSILLSIYYLSFPPIIMSNLYDFHEEAFLPLAVISGYYLFLRRRFLLASLAFVFTALLQEAAIPILFFVGLQIFAMDPSDLHRLFAERRWNLPGGIALLLMISSPVAFLLENVLIRNINPAAGFIATSSTAYGLSLLNASSNLLQKGFYWIALLAFAAFLPVSVKKTLILAVPWFAVSFFGNNPAFSQFSWQYSFYIVPALFIGIVYGMQRLLSLSSLPLGTYRWPQASKRLYKILPIVFIIAALILTPLYPLAIQDFPSSRYTGSYTGPSNNSQLQELFHLIPPGVAVLSSDFLFAHVATSFDVYPIIYGFNRSTGSWYLDTYLPLGFSPQFIAIIPSDYNSTATLVTGFPSSYGIIAEVTVQTSQILNLNSREMLVQSVVLYRFGYSGPAEVFAPFSANFDYRDLKAVNGSYVGDLTSSSGTVLYSPANGVANGIFWVGPFTSQPFVLPPGRYTAEFYLKLGSESNPPNAYVVTLIVRSAEQPPGVSFASESVNVGELAGDYRPVSMNFTLTSPAGEMSLAGIDVSPQYSLYLDHIVLSETSTE